MNTSELTESTLMIIARLRAENEALKAKLTEPAQEPKPVAWMHIDKTSTCTNNTKLYGGVVGYDTPLYTTPPDAAKRIAELEGQLSDARSELMKTEQKAIDYDLSDLEGLVTENEALKLQVSAAKTVIASQEPEPVAWIEQYMLDCLIKYPSSRWMFHVIGKQFADNTIPLYQTPPDAVKRIAELEDHLDHEKLCIKDYVNAIAELKEKINYLEARINNGVRVESWVNNAGLMMAQGYGLGESDDCCNAVLLLDEQGD